MLSSRSMDPASIFRIGTSGYSFPDWVGPFYPPGTRETASGGGGTPSGTTRPLAT